MYRYLFFTDFNLPNLIIVMPPIFNGIPECLQMVISMFGSIDYKRCILTDKPRVLHAVQAFESGGQTVYAPVSKNGFNRYNVFFQFTPFHFNL